MGGRRDPLPFPLVGEQANHLSLMGRVHEAVEQRNCDRLDRFLTHGFVLDRTKGGADAANVERFDLIARGVETALHALPQITRYQHRGVGRTMVPLVLAKSSADLECIAEPFGCEQGDLCPLALEHRVRGHRGPVDEESTVRQQFARRHAQVLGQAGESVHHPLARVRRHRRDLGDPRPSRSIGQHQVGESSADVDADPPRSLRFAFHVAER